MINIDKQAIDFSKPLETESGEPVKHICHDVIEYKCARVCVDIATGVVYSSPYVGLKIRNKEASPRAKLREQIESAADAYRQFDNGWISEMKCGELSHEYLLFVKEPKNVLALLGELKSAENNLIDSECHVAELEEALCDKQALLEASEKRIAEQSAIVAAAEKLVRCKGRYHSEQNYRALAVLFGVTTPDLPPLEGEALLDELEAKDVARSAQDYHFDQQADRIKSLEKSLEAAEKRIAELEARQPYGYLRQCDGQIQISIGSERPHDRSGGYATPWFAIYTAAGIGKGE